MKYLMKLENWWKESTKFLSKKKKELYKKIKPSKLVDIARLGVIFIIILIALSAIVSFVIYGIILSILFIGIYFLLPDTLISDIRNKLVGKPENKKAPENKKTSENKKLPSNKEDK